jgi:hypothetical protein
MNSPKISGSVQTEATDNTNTHTETIEEVVVTEAEPLEAVSKPIRYQVRPKGYITASDAARLANVPAPNINNWVKRGYVKAITTNEAIEQGLFDAEQIQALEERRRKGRTAYFQHRFIEVESLRTEMKRRKTARSKRLRLLEKALQSEADAEPRLCKACGQKKPLTLAYWSQVSREKDKGTGNSRKRGRNNQKDKIYWRNICHSCQMKEWVAYSSRRRKTNELAGSNLLKLAGYGDVTMVVALDLADALKSVETVLPTVPLTNTLQHRKEVLESFIQRLQADLQTIPGYVRAHDANKSAFEKVVTGLNESSSPPPLLYIELKGKLPEIKKALEDSKPNLPVKYWFLQELQNAPFYSGKLAQGQEAS